MRRRSQHPPPPYAPPTPQGWAAPLAALLCLLVLGLAFPAAGRGQEPIRIDGMEDLDFDRPEAWAMKYFGSVSFLTDLGTPADPAPGAVHVGFEGGWLPELSEEERRVGFLGNKEEDLNRSDLFGRVRLTVGLPNSFVLTAGYVPPVEIDGIEPHLFALGLGRTLWNRGRFRLGATLSGEAGTFSGDITCSGDAVDAGDDPVANPFGCTEPSSDEMEVRYGGLQVTGRVDLGRWTPHLGLLTSYFDTEFQVDARYRNVIDTTRLRTDGWTWGATAGLAWRADERIGLSAEAFYAPLRVFRERTAPTETDALFHARALVTFRVRAPNGP